MSQLTEPQILGGATERPLTPSARDRAIAAYIVLALLLLLPGALAAAHLGLDETTLPGAWLAAIDLAMQRIAFGSTPRFWMGVTGASMMALLLLYPLRKKFGLGQAVSVAAWFHLHTVLGLFGPVLVLYHCNFGTGSTPANVALVTTIAVALSGIFGHFVHSRLSARYHQARKRAHDHLLDARAELARLTATPSRNKFFEALDAFEREPATGRGIWRRSSGQARTDLIDHARWLVENQGAQDGWQPSRRTETATRIASSLSAYFDGLAAATRSGRRQRIAGAWRLLHMPLFVVTVVAVLIHVAKVWNMDATREAAIQVTTMPDAAIGSRVSDVKGAFADTRASLEQNTLVSPPRSAPFATRKVTTSEMPGKIAPAAKPEQPAPRVKLAPRRAAETPTLVETPKLAEAPKLAELRRPPDNPIPVRPSGPREAAPMALGGAQTAPIAAPVPGNAPPATSTPDAISELAKSLTRWDNTGRLDPTVVRDRIAELKQDRAFNHDRTGFPLTGQHKPLACESCHKTTLKDTAHACIDCHKKDDVHRGRRATCESCHVTTDWSTIRRK